MRIVKRGERIPLGVSKSEFGEPLIRFPLFLWWMERDTLDSGIVERKSGIWVLVVIVRVERWITSVKIFWAPTRLAKLTKRFDCFDKDGWCN